MTTAWRLFALLFWFIQKKIKKIKVIVAWKQTKCGVGAALPRNHSGVLSAQAHRDTYGEDYYSIMDS